MRWLSLSNWHIKAAITKSIVVVNISVTTNGIKNNFGVYPNVLRGKESD